MRIVRTLMVLTNESVFTPSFWLKNESILEISELPTLPRMKSSDGRKL